MSRLEELRRLRNRVTGEINELERRYGRRMTPADDARAVLEQAAWRHHVSVGDILSKSRLREVVRARQEAAWEFRQLNLSYPQIGAILGRDHSTVLLAVRKIDAQQHSPQGVAEPVDNQAFAQRHRTRIAGEWGEPAGAPTPDAGSDRQPVYPGRG